MDNQPTTTPSPAPYGPGTPSINPVSTQPEQQKVDKPKGPPKPFTKFLLLIVIIAISIGGTYYWQHKKVDNINTQLSSLQKQVTSLSTTLKKDNQSTTTATTTLTPTKTTTTKSADTLPTGTISTTGITGSYTYPNGYFSLMYPASWELSANSVPTSSSQPGILPTVVTIAPPNYAQGEVAGITVYKSTSLSSALTYEFVGNGTTVENNQSLTINGYGAMYQQNVISGNGGGQTKDSYAITNGQYTVVLTFETIGTPSDPGGFNATGLLPEFNAIVNSVKF